MPQLQDSAAAAPFDPALPPSPSLLLYLFAERVAPPARFGVKAPLTGTHVNTHQLARALFAVAFWHLREARIIQLAVAEEHHFLKTITHVGVTLAAPNPAPQDGIAGGVIDLLTPGSRGKLTPAWDGLPQWLKNWSGKAEDIFTERYASMGYTNLPTPSPDPPPATVYDVMLRWYGRDMANPARLPIAWTEREGVAKGFLGATDAHRNPLLAIFMGNVTITPERANIATLESAFTDLATRWNNFKTAEAALASQLDHEIDAAITARTQVSETTS